ncbi:ribosome biogenesis GTPase Der [Patescibacteria group bacterium]|nr:ribosome biogenesis GTPase Der [Patescibacteria group bacterium]
MKQIKKITLIGRANVGKSTLFNTLIEQKKAIVSDVAGTTRDRNYACLSWRGFEFELIDTGGIDIVHPKDIEKDILQQANFAQNQADLILFLVDVKEGLMPQDKEIAKLLKKSGKSLILVANKADSNRLKNSVADFYKLNIGDPAAISAISGAGTGDLLDRVVDRLQAKTKKTINDTQYQPKADRPPLGSSSGRELTDTIPSSAEATAGRHDIRIAIIGKPNSGKSTLVNSILGEERMITSPQPYTTRDAQNINLKYKGSDYVLIDTAGIRKKAKVKNKLEKFSVIQALESIKNADVTLLMTDVSEPLGKQDKTLSDEIIKTDSSIILVANKWDKEKNKDSNTINKFIKYYQAFFPYLRYAPIIFISALEKQRVKKVLDLAKEVYDERFREITDNALDKFLKKIIKKQPPSRGKGNKHPKLYQLKQLGTDPPRFEIIKDYKSDLHESYVRFIENQLREKFGFLGTPVIIKVRKLKNL